MSAKRMFSLFISSTYEDLREERQALMGVALESSFIPVGMEQFHAAPVTQWDVITRMIDECDFYLLMIGGRYGSIDAAAGISYTEKEYEYAKQRNTPVLALIKDPHSITGDKTDFGDDKHEKQKKLDEFREKVKSDGNTIDFYKDLNGLKYAASQTLRKAVEYARQDAGWVRYADVAAVINEKVKERELAASELVSDRETILKDTHEALHTFEDRLQTIEDRRLTWGDLPIASEDDVKRLFE